MDVVVATTAGVPGEELLEELEAYFEERREIAVDVQVRAPETKTVDVTVSVVRQVLLKFKRLNLLKQLVLKFKKGMPSKNVRFNVFSVMGK